MGANLVSLGYWTVCVPWVQREFRTEWHPTTDVGPLCVVSRGAFPTTADAIRWAQTNLNGTPYSLRYVGPDGS